MAGTERKRAGHVGTKSAVALNEQPRRLALSQAGVLKRRPLIKTGRDQHDAAEYTARACHYRREQRASFQRPFSRRRGESKNHPRKKITPADKSAPRHTPS